MPHCPICGHPGTYKVHSLCPCCGQVTGTDEAQHHALMRQWIAAGCLFFGPRVPEGWDAYAQLLRAGLINRGGFDLRTLPSQPSLRQSA